MFYHLIDRYKRFTASRNNVDIMLSYSFVLSALGNLNFFLQKAFAALPPRLWSRTEHWVLKNWHWVVLFCLGRGCLSKLHQNLFSQWARDSHDWRQFTVLLAAYQICPVDFTVRTLLWCIVKCKITLCSASYGSVWRDPLPLHPTWPGRQLLFSF